MPHEHHSDNDEKQAEGKAQLTKIFESLQYEVPVFLFTSKDNTEPFPQAARQILQTMQQISPRIKFTEYPIDHKQAQQWDVQRAPAILFDPEHFNIRWLGAPLGEEGKILVEALVMLGNRKSNLSEQSQQIIEQITAPRNTKVFVSITCPYCPQQAINLLKAAIAKPKQVSLEIIDVQANPDLADEYKAFSTPMTFVDKTLIAKGAQPEELAILSLEKQEEQNIFIPDVKAKEIETDLVIVGGGPAGLSAGIYAARSGLNAIILERGILGGQIATTPEVENYPGISQITGKTLVEIMVSHALQYAKIFPGEEALDIKPGDPIEVVTTKRRFLTQAVLLATGAQYKHLNIPGEERLAGRGVSYCSTCDGPHFRDKNVIMVGGGNSAVTEALHLNNIGVNITLVHRRDKLRAHKHLANKLFADKTPVLWNTQVQAILGKEQVEEVELLDNQTGKTRLMKVDGVFIAIGYLPEVELARKIEVELTPEGYIKKDKRHRTNLPGIYSAGDVEGGYKQIVTAAAQGAEAALSIFEDLIGSVPKTPH